LTEFWTNFSWVAFLHVAAIVVAIPAVLITKKGSTSPIAWCLVILLVPLLGSLLFWIFGYTYLYRPLKRKQRHRVGFHDRLPSGPHGAIVSDEWNHIARVAWELDDSPPSQGNAVKLYPNTVHAFAAMLEAIRAAQHHIHLEFYIVRNDDAGKEFIALLTEKARQGVKVRFLYDSMGGFFFGRRGIQDLLAAGGQVVPFLPLNLFRSRMRVNLRNHRKIVIVDAKVGFTGGMNLGDEYLGRSKKFGYWRDQMLRLEGPAMSGLQRIFVEDWDFTTKEMLSGTDYFPSQPQAGDSVVQVIASGPDQQVNVIREVYMAMIASARERVWIATPYFIPDAGILDALHLARYRGADVRLLMPLVADHFSSHFASRYYWQDILPRGVQLCLYTRGMMHSKFIAVDSQICIVGSANMDPRSLQLNFEAGCVLFDAALTKELEASFEEDMQHAQCMDLDTFNRRSFATRLAENACRLFSPIL
jgi:cardiolipin synthase A/B